jgi:hypothetical protein
MALHFAYGSNMSRSLMGARCPHARALGLARLFGWRFVINPEGFGSLVPQAGGRVHGVLWRLNARDVAAINAYEGVGSGLYLRRHLPVQWSGPKAGQGSMPELDDDCGRAREIGSEDSSAILLDRNGAPPPTPRHRTTTALVYIARKQGEGTPRPGYIGLVVDAAREWKLPESYVCTLKRWSPSGWRGVRPRDTGELG